MIFVYLIIIVAALAFINFITNRLLRNMKEDYGSMLSNSEKSDEEVLIKTQEDINKEQIRKLQELRKEKEKKVAERKKAEENLIISTGEFTQNEIDDIISQFNISLTKAREKEDPEELMKSVLDKQKRKGFQSDKGETRR